RLGIEADSLVLQTVVLERRSQPLWCPGGRIGGLFGWRWVERVKGGLMLSDRPRAQEHEDSRPNRRRERLRVGRDIGCGGLTTRGALPLAGERRRKWLIGAGPHPLPFVCDGGVDLPKECSEVELGFALLVGLDAVWNGLGQHLVDIVEVAQQQAF